MSSSSTLDDPRDPSLESRLSLPKTWATGGTDGFSAISMFLAGAVMVTRNRYLGWPAFLLSLSSFVNQHPVRTKDGGNSWSGLAMSLGALVTGYLPMFLINANPVQNPIPTT